MTEKRTALNRLPPAIWKLVRCVTVAFYSQEQQIVMELMAHFRRITEEDLTKMLCLRKVQFQAAVNDLIKDKFLLSRKMPCPEDDGGVQSRGTYYGVNYAVLINMVKYKLYAMRLKIEEMEKESKSNSFYRCSGCSANFNELDVLRLSSHLTGSLVCYKCSSEVKEVDNREADEEFRRAMSTYNTGMAPIIELLQKIDEDGIPDEFLEPDPPSLPSEKANKEETTMNSGLPSMKTKREMPPWCRDSDKDIGSETTQSAIESILSTDPVDPNEIMEVLTSFEKGFGLNSTASTDRGSCTPPTEMQVDEEEDDEEDFFVNIGDEKVSCSDVTDEMVARMSEEEKEEYIRVARQAYEWLNG